MTAPTDERPPEAPPPEAEWVHVEPPPSFGNRSEPDTSDEDRGRPLGQWVLAGGSAATLGGVGLFSAFGPVGLAAGAVVAAGGAALYGYHRVRRGKRPGFKTTRMRTRSGRSTSRLGSVGKGRSGKLLGGKGAKLGGGRGSKLGKGGGPKLGKGGKLGGRSGKLLGGKGAKLGGRSGKLGGGRSGKLLGGGRGSKLGGKLGRKATSRLGSVGKGGGKLLGRGGKAGAGLGKRSGKLLGSKGKTGFGRWGKSAGGGAGVLGRRLGKAARKTGRGAATLAGKTKTGQRAARGFRAAKAALASQSPGKGRWKNARQATRAALRSNQTRYNAWATSLGAAFLAFAALIHERMKKRQAKKQTAAEPEKKAAEQKPRRCTWCGTGIEEDEVREVVLHGLPCTVCPTCYKPHDPHRQQNTTTTTTGAIGPGVAPHTTPTRRRVFMEGGFPMATAAAEVNVAAAAYEPPDMWHVATDMKQMPDVFANVALGLRTYMSRLQGQYPIAPGVVNEVGELYAGLTQLAQRAQELEGHFRAAHADDLKRGETPRTGEHHWNV